MRTDPSITARLLACALDLRTAGVLVFPGTADAKHPDRGLWFADGNGKSKPRWTAPYYPTDGWPSEDDHRRAFEDRRTRQLDLDIHRLFVAAGSRSDGTVCLEFDNDAEEIRPAWEALLPPGLLDRCYVEESQGGRGRCHIAFKVDHVLRSEVLAKTEGGKVRIELIAENKVFAVSPGRGYQRVQGSLLRLPRLSAEEIAPIIEAAKTFDRYVPETTEPKPSPSSRYQPARMLSLAPAWSGGERADLAAIKERFDLLAYAIEHFPGDIREEGDEVRILGNNGLFIAPTRGVWRCYAETVGGDCLDLVGYVRYGAEWDRRDPRMFMEALREAAAFAGVVLPPRPASRPASPLAPRIVTTHAPTILRPRIVSLR